MLHFYKVRALSSTSPKAEYRLFLLFLTGLTFKVFSSKMMITRPAGTYLRSLTSTLHHSRHLIWDLTPSFATTRRSVADPIQTLLVWWRTDVLGLLRTASCKLSWFNRNSVTARASVHTFVIVHPFLDRVDSCSRHTIKFATWLVLCPASRCAQTITYRKSQQ